MSGDIFVPQTSGEHALVSQLLAVTYVSPADSNLHAALTEGMQLDTGQETVSASPETNHYLGFPNNAAWQARTYNREHDYKNVSLRVLYAESPESSVRPGIDGAYVGGLSVGFPMSDFDRSEVAMTANGCASTIGLKTMEFTGPDGQVYTSGEIHFPTADHAFLLGVQRPDAFVPVGPLDPKKGVGAPAYSARCVADSDNLIKFFETVLGYEMRRDMTMGIGENSGLRMQPGGEERFIQLFAPGAETGYLVLLDHGSVRKPASTPLGPPHTGVVMWSFETRNLEEVADRARHFDCEVQAPIAERKSPLLPFGRTMIIRDPGGFPLEFCEPT